VYRSAVRVIGSSGRRLPALLVDFPDDDMAVRTATRGRLSARLSCCK
jgi:hypothetical protein